ncbi:MAG: hypothetical protein IPG88_25470 [Gemmatimonadetes bacterium]|nr:hypothetical protein [Gemmatimonadota bacterium]
MSASRSGVGVLAVVGERGQHGRDVGMAGEAGVSGLLVEDLARRSGAFAAAAR